MEKQDIAQIASFIKEASDAVTKLQGQRDSALTKVASLEAELGQQKTASAQHAVGDSEAVSRTVDRLIKAKFLKEASREAAIAAMVADPMEGINFLDKLATKSIENKKTTPLGAPVVEKVASAIEAGQTVRESDLVFAKHFGGA